MEAEWIGKVQNVGGTLDLTGVLRVETSCEPKLHGQFRAFGTLTETDRTVLRDPPRMRCVACKPERVSSRSNPVIVARSRILSSGFGELAKKSCSQRSRKPQAVEAIDAVVDLPFLG